MDGQLGYVAFLRKDCDAASALLTPHLFDEDGLSTCRRSTSSSRSRATRRSGRPTASRWRGRRPRRTKSVAVRATLGEFLLRSAEEADRAEGEKILTGLAKESRRGPSLPPMCGSGSRSTAGPRTRLGPLSRPTATIRICSSGSRPPSSGRRRWPSRWPLSRSSSRSGARPRGGLNYLGYMWAERGENLARALELIQKAVDLDPGNGAYLDSLGWTYFQLGKLDLARKSLQTAFELSPDDPTIEEHLGDLGEKLGEIGKARAHWKRALTLKPEDGGKKLGEKLHRTEGVADNLGKK